MSFLKDYKRPPFSKSRKVNPIVKPLPSTLGSSSAMALGSSVHPFQSAASAYSSTPSACDKSTRGPQLPEHSWQLDFAGPDPSSSSQISPLGSAASYSKRVSSVSLVQKKNARTTPVHVPRPRSNNYMDSTPERLTTYDQNYPPGGPSSLARTRPIMSDIRDTIQNEDYDTAPAIFGAPSARISSELPTASHQDHPCFVSDLPKTINPSQPRTPQPLMLQTTAQVGSLPTTGVKRRLGMGRTAGGYSNKKFKPPT